MRLLAVAAALVPLLSACATSSQVQAAYDHNYGVAPERSIWHGGVKSWFDGNLKDPESARYKVGCLVKGYVKNAALSGRPGMEFVGWLARVDVNAKNSYGGYNGFKPYIAAVEPGGSVRIMYEPLSEIGFDHPRIHVVESKPCATPTGQIEAPRQGA